MKRFSPENVFKKQHQGFDCKLQGQVFTVTEAKVPKILMKAANYDFFSKIPEGEI